MTHPLLTKLVGTLLQGPENVRRTARKTAEEERRVPEIHVDHMMDLMFMGDEKEGATLAFLVAREKETKAVFSTVVPR